MVWNYIIGSTPEGRLELASSYTRVFKGGNATKEDMEAVLVDIVSFSGLFSVKPEGANLERHEGARSVGGLVFSMVNLPQSERDKLYEATREKQLEEQHYGT